MQIQNQKLKRFLKITMFILVVVLISLYSFRNTILEQLIAKITHKANTEYNSNFTIKKAAFDGVSGLTLTDIVLAPKNADTLLKIKKIKTSVNLFQLVMGDVQLGSLQMSDGYLQLTQKGKLKNYAAFLTKNESDEISDEKTNYANYTYRIITKLLDLVPTNMEVKNLEFKIDDNGKKAQININNLTLIDKKIETTINVVTNTFNQRWKIKGLADPRNKTADIRFFNLDKGAIQLPYFDQAYHLNTSFDSIRLKIENIEKSNGKLHIDGYASVVNLKINHPKIARKDVIINKTRFDYHFLLGSDFISIDSSSTIQLNKIKLHPYLAYDTEEDTIYKLKVAIPKMKAQDFITSLPDGLFTHFQGMVATGNFDYKLNFKFNKNKPNQLIFDSNLKKENLKILKYGEANLTKLNGEFEYRAIIKDVLQRSIFVGTANPNYATLDQISPYLQKCVLTSEDPSFFTHRGFINEAFKQSIVKNIRTKKFSRGASTISMQLIKNVFLTREKTLSRKLEEILLVYLLENNRIASKERMLEVYFNIIEWGPDVYGIGEAAQFYFQKKPADLTLNECLYLARIIPSPSKFMYQFNADGMLKDYAKKNEGFLRNLMFKRGLLVPEDTIGQSIPFTIYGNSRTFLKLKDSTAIDSIVVQKEF